jgi:hypothetical protein
VCGKIFASALQNVLQNFVYMLQGKLEDEKSILLLLMEYDYSVLPLYSNQ